MLLYPQFPADWLTFTEKKLNKKLLISCYENSSSIDYLMG